MIISTLINFTPLHPVVEWSIKDGVGVLFPSFLKTEEFILKVSPEQPLGGTR